MGHDEEPKTIVRRRLTRKGFLGVGLGLGCTSLLVACGGAAAPAQPTTKPASPATAAPAPASSAPPPAPAATSAAVATTAPAQAGVTITMVASSDYQAVYEAAAKELKDKTGTGVNLITQAYDQTHDKIVSGVAGGADYDIVSVDIIWTGEFAQAGFIGPLDDRISEDLKSKMVPAAIAGRSYKGKIYQWPTFSFKLLYYNNDLLKKAGISELPKTLEEFTAACKTSQEKAGIKFGTAWAMTQAEGLSCDYVMLLKGFGGQFTDDKGNWIINQGGGLKALQFMCDSLYKDKTADPASLTLTDRTVRNPFMNGDYLFIVNWNSAWAQAKDPQSSKIVDAVRIGLIPGAKDASVVSTSCTGGSGWGLVAKGKKKDQAWQYVDAFAMSSDAQRRLLKMVNVLPTLKALYDEPQIKTDYPQFELMRKQMDYGVARPELPWYGEWSKTLQIEVTNALSQKKQPQQALDDAVKAMNEMAKQYQ